MNEKTLRVLEYGKIIQLLVNKTESSLGKDIASNLSPSIDLEEVEYFQKETDEAVSILIKRGNPPLGGIHDVLPEVKRAEIGSVLSPGGLLKVADTLRAARRIKGFLGYDKGDRESSYPLLGGLTNDLNTYRDVEEAIFNAIISEEEISDSASSLLKSIRKQIILKNDSIRNKLNSIISSSSNKKMLQDGIITIREDRFVVPVKQEYRTSFPGLIHDQSSSGATLFIEPMAVVQLNNELKELRLKEKAEIERILAELTENVATASDGIRENQKKLAQIDFIFAKGKLSLNMKGIKPELNGKGYINIKKGRHPLLNVDKVVPTDIYIGDKFNTLVITGPNTGGKTVTLKTLGLFTLMVQSGLQIPVEYGTKMAVFKNVFADIGDEQSIEQSLSTFSSHMTNIVDILKNVEDNSLVLFDELGAGTDPTEGAALAMAILNHLHRIDVRTVATTHYSELKVYALTTEGVENASVEFDVETLSPTYRLLIGVPGKSNAFEISKRLGLNDYIIQSAKELVSKENIEFEDILANIERDRRESEHNKEETQRLKEEIQKLKSELLEKKEKLENMRDETIRQAKREARKILKDAKEESESIINEIRNISTEIEKEKNKRLQEARDKIRTNLESIEGDLSENIIVKKNTKPPKNLKPGENVILLGLNQEGIVLNQPDESGNVMVQVGIMKISVHISTLSRARKEEKIESKVAVKSIVRTKASNIKNELDLRGKNLDEAMLDVDKYLDDAYIAGLKTVYIIHGKGTGILREGIGQLLRGHKHVKSYRLGNYGEGGTGVTVVEIK
ncbi:DNA mismatch repair protein MutS2 [Proteiniborus ethanoligenes]|uniref:Endonuclease MutS2 n=1 Tax=Proteiniborus ethanoligenes TaxID=415015 RepID=A0A1H3RXM8_9FIRM|nr:endonuclease MutS2 [Proteiniborus ethanoligenes]SDZ29619.1 DNA mismatch repair protein MutS2 [Proteiniborus ethanoligenes]